MQERPIPSNSSRLWALSLFGGVSLILAGLVACGGDAEDGEGQGPNAAGGLGAYTPGSAASQAPTAPGAGPPAENPGTSSSSSGEPEVDAGGSSSSSGAAPTDGGGGTPDSGTDDGGS